jgi:hypothetical protein
MKMKPLPIIKSAVIFIFLFLIIASSTYAIKFDPQSIIIQNHYGGSFHQPRSLVLADNIPICISPNATGDSTFTKKGLYKKKSPWLAFGLALGPGFVVHGLGNYYAGHKKAAWVLFGTEIFATTIIVWDYNRWRINKSYTTDKVSLGFFAGLYLYTSWMYDVIWAPSNVLEDNKKHFERTK